MLARFLETIVSARKVKMHLIAAEHKETALILWLKTTFQDYLSIMPLVFDIIHSFATPLYGFDQQILLEATQNERTFMNDRKSVVDLDHLVVDFLRRHEKAGGNAMAVAIVLDTDGLVDKDDENQAPNKPTSTQQPASPAARETQPRHEQLQKIELGFVLRGQNRPGGLTKNPSQPPLKLQPNPNATNKASSTNNDKEQQAPEVAEPRPWPAVYLRSSTRLSNPPRGTTTGSSSGMGLISSMRRSANSVRGSANALDASSQHGMHVDGSPRSRFRKSPSAKRFSLLSHGNVFEYETEPSERPVWPHSEWGRLRSLLDDMSSGTLPVHNIIEADHTSTPTSPTPHSSMYDGPMAFTFHPDGEDPEVAGAAESSSAALDSRVGIFSSEFGKQLWDPTSIPSGGGTTSGIAASIFHAVKLNNNMWMIGTCSVHERIT
jgi:hypothetical protein